MADVRAMLRSELASRKAPEQASSKKRKAAAEQTQPESKKPKSEATSHPITASDPSAADSPPTTLPTRDSPPESAHGKIPLAADASSETTTAQPTQAADDIDEDEWAAFERDVATPPADSVAQPEPAPSRSALNAPATITAQPLSAAELAAQAREEQSVQRGRRDVELEEEKEEAQQALQEEFEEMEGLEERVRRLREQREAIRRASDSRPRPAVAGVDEDGELAKAGMEAVMEEDQGSESESEGDDEWDLWKR